MTPRDCEPSFDATDRLLQAMFVRALRRTAVLAVSTGAVACGRTPLSVEEALHAGTGPDAETPFHEVDAGHESDASVAVPSEFAAVPCFAALNYDLRDFRLSRTVDYLEARTADADGQHYSGGTLGDPCGGVYGAHNIEACLNELSEIEASIVGPGTYPDPYERYLLTTEGDVVRIWLAPGGLKTILGDIDTLSEAVYWLAATRVALLTCGDIFYSAQRQVPGGFELRNLVDDCGNKAYVTTYFVDPTGSVEILAEEETTSTCVVGRRPEGLVAACAEGSALGRHFARMAHLEAGAVHAFAVLEAELRELGAPALLLSKVRQAIADEERHAMEATALAQRFGATPPPVVVEPRALRDAFALALDNAGEGCVNETYAALVATHQASAAQDPEVRRVMARIALDETRHAGLSHQLAAWLEPQLDAEQLLEVRRVQQLAFAQLRAELARPESDEVIRVAGVPVPTRALALLRELEASLVGARAELRACG